jgi:hypothetical protein
MINYKIDGVKIERNNGQAARSPMKIAKIAEG